MSLQNAHFGSHLLFMIAGVSFLMLCCAPEKSQVGMEEAPILRPEYEPDSNKYNVGFLIMDGVFNTELTAPYDIFHHTRFREGIKAMNVFTLANSKQPVKTFEGLYLLPDFDYTKDILPRIDILVVPSAEHHLDTDLENREMLGFVKETGSRAEYVLSLCDGAFVLAKSGLLDSVASTTFPGDLDRYGEMFPHLNVLHDVSFVHDGKYITSAGGAVSFEAALYLAEFLYGKEIAERLAQGLVIDWDLEGVKHFSQADL